MQRAGARAREWGLWTYWTPLWGASSQALGTGAEKRRHTRKFQNGPSLLRRGYTCTSNQTPSIVQRKCLLEAKPWVGFMPFLKGGFDPRGSLFLGHYFGSKQNMISVSTSKNHCLLGAGQCRQSRATWLVSKRRIRPRDGFDYIQGGLQASQCFSVPRPCYLVN